jgi:hypothetical protein
VADERLLDAIEGWASAHRNLKASEDELLAALVSLGPEGCGSRARHLVGSWRRLELAKQEMRLAVTGEDA